MFGDYESLEDGCTADALIDFTGGVAQKVDMEECGARNDDVVKLTLFNELVEAADNKSLIVSSIKVIPVKIYSLFFLSNLMNSYFLYNCPLSNEYNSNCLC